MISIKDNRAIFAVALIIRLIIFNIPSLSNTLIQRVELVTPITSFKRLTEGVYLYNHNVPPYDGDVIHQPPLLLCFFSFVLMLPNLTPVLFSVVDVLIAHALGLITRLKQDQQRPKLKDEVSMQSISPWTVSVLYLFNPLTILSCVAKSTLIFTNLAVVMAILSSLRQRPKTAMFWIALASYLSFYPIMLVPAFLIILKSFRSGVFFILFFMGLIGASFLVMQSWHFLSATYGIILFVSDLTPNVGMFWYFFIEIFDQFRSFFMVVFQFHTFIFTVPICIKLYHQPIFAVTVLCGIMAIFKSYPSAGDAALYLALVPIHDELLKYCRYGFLVSNLFLYASVLAPIFWHLWIYAGSGNANFFYAITLVYNLGQVVLLIDLVYAALRREFDILHPDTIGKQVI
ncbi:GPI transamidase component, partial [Blakeslea trispora]